MKRKCPPCKYYCYTDKKCKKIPKGFKVVGRMGYLRRENGFSKDEETKKNGNGSSNGNGNGGNGSGNGNGGSGGNGGGNGMGESIVYEASNPRIPRKPGQPAKSKKHSDLYTDEDPKGTILFMDLVSRTWQKQERLYQKSGILLDRMLIRFKRLLLWNKGRERWVKPLRQQSIENISTR